MQGIEPAYILVILQRHRSACTFGTRGTPLYFLSPPQAGPGALLSLLSGVSPRVLPLNCSARVTPHYAASAPNFLFSFRSSGSPFPSILRFSLRVLRSLLFYGFLFGFSVPFYSAVLGFFRLPSLAFSGRDPGLVTLGSTRHPWLNSDPPSYTRHGICTRYCTLY